MTGADDSSEAVLQGPGGRVHPKDEAIRKHTPVYMKGSPDEDAVGLKKLINSKKGKRLHKILPKLFRQWSADSKMAEAQVKELSEAFADCCLDGWKLKDENSSQWNYQNIKKENLSLYFEILVHNPSAPDKRSLGSPDWEILLELYGLLGGDLAVRYDLDGRGLIHLAAVQGLPNVITWLVKHGVDPNHPTGYNRMGITSMSTPLHLAIMHMRLNSIRALCQLPNIKINQRNASGKSPLHGLADASFCTPMGFDNGRGPNETVQVVLDLLLESGADPKALVKGPVIKRLAS